MPQAKLFFKARDGGRLFGAAAELTVQPLEWIHVMPMGHWAQFRGWGSEAGYIEYMEPFDITPEHIQEMMANFQRYQPLQVPAYYEHSDLFFADTKAAGWITAVEARADGLWAKINWTPAALKMIQDQEYKYISPSWMMNYTDAQAGQKVGARLLSIGLTNDPFFETGLQQQIAAKEREMDELKQIAVALGLAETATLDEILAAIKALKDDAEGESETAAQSRAIVERLRAELKLPSTAKAEEYVAAVKARETDQSTLAAQVQELRTAAAKDKAERLVDAAMAAGKIAAANKPWAVEFATKDADGFTQWAASAPTVVPAAGHLPKTPPPDNQNPEPTETEKKIAAMTGGDAKLIAAQRVKQAAAQE